MLPVLLLQIQVSLKLRFLCCSSHIDREKQITALHKVCIYWWDINNYISSYDNFVDSVLYCFKRLKYSKKQESMTIQNNNDEKTALLQGSEPYHGYILR